MNPDMIVADMMRRDRIEINHGNYPSQVCPGEDFRDCGQPWRPNPQASPGAVGAPVNAVVGQTDDIGECWRDFILGDIDAGFEWALHPMMCNRSENMERFILSAKREIDRLRLERLPNAHDQRPHDRLSPKDDK